MVAFPAHGESVNTFSSSLSLHCGKGFESHTSAAVATAHVIARVTPNAISLGIVLLCPGQPRVRWPIVVPSPDRACLSGARRGGPSGPPSRGQRYSQPKKRIRLYEPRDERPPQAAKALQELGKCSGTGRRSLTNMRGIERTTRHNPGICEI